MLPFLFLQSHANDVARELVIECDILYPLKLGSDPVVGPTDKAALFSQIDMNTLCLPQAVYECQTQKPKGSKP